MLFCLWLFASAPFLVIASAQAGPDRFGVTFVPGAASRPQIEKAVGQNGITLIEIARNTHHSVLLVRRTKAGEAEVHNAITDVWYVIDGSGTLLTGGKLVHPKNSQAGEVRGTAVSGGTARHIGTGDIIDIPAGVPHWVRQVDGRELVYLTVKIAAPKR